MEHNLGNTPVQEERSGRMLIHRLAVGPLTGARMPTRERTAEVEYEVPGGLRKRTDLREFG